ncbi:hypothetical protein CVIRNUC_008291 [Coccomyxa viridis]|uniref:Phosphatidylserine decarboxylase n=1 Tax=Coccomyxa viridis TaxID=1274662 RepID=A0AAV1IFR2_9CHLO|nr:hypothetical protein CVIRNUC_008291 [Coccomyxa viridis]
MEQVWKEWAHFWLGPLPAFQSSLSPVVITRQGEIVKEKVPLITSVQLGFLHATWIGQQLARTSLLKWYLAWSSAELGMKYDSPESAALIQRFIEAYGVDMSDVQGSPQDYRTLNAFFSRQLRPGARPIHEPGNASHAVQPTDARLMVFESVSEATTLWIKGEHFNLRSLCNNMWKAERLDGCSLVISRLAPQDYHRFHAPCDGSVRRVEHVSGTYYSVKPVAVKSPIDVYDCNKRSILELDSHQFGPVLYIAIAAVQVGSIQLSVESCDSVKKGQELGSFLYGGSTVITLFRRGAIKYDADLQHNSRERIETLVRMGTSLGIAQ